MLLLLSEWVNYPTQLLYRHLKADNTYSTNLAIYRANIFWWFCPCQGHVCPQIVVKAPENEPC